MKKGYEIGFTDVEHYWVRGRFHFSLLKKLDAMNLKVTHCVLGTRHNFDTINMLQTYAMANK
eukprot:snap_masked-scaffold_1-processed-gene-2.14-mRNA-1 protein AED:1.00 eAED:1.00 QI:0/0/0/0/1/1/2/0/61